MIGDLSTFTPPSRDEMKAQLAQLPPVPKDGLAFAVANADVLDDREDYLAAIGEVYDATAYGRRQKIVRIGIGAALGLTLGVLVGKFAL